MAPKKPNTDPPEPMHESLVARIHFGGTGWTQTAPTKHLIETPLLGIRLLCQQEYFWQYDPRCVLILEYNGDPFLYVPVRPHIPVAQWGIEKLPVIRLADLDNCLEPVRQRFELLRTHWYVDDLNASIQPIPAIIDAAPWIWEDLKRLYTDKLALQETLAVLDLFACFRGESENLPFPQVLFGAEAIALVQHRQPDALTKPVRAELEAESLILRQDDSRRYVAVIDRNEPMPGNVGGYNADISIVTLTVSAETGKWSYQRRVVWSENVEGIPLS